mgnify:FL=1
MTNRNVTTFPIMTTERITLRQLSIDDQQDVFDLRSDAEVNKYLNRQPCLSSEAAINFINQVNDNIEKNIALYWAITLTETKTFVGTICIFDFTNDKNSCEIGYELMTKFQGQGIMKEAVQLVIDYVFKTLKIKNIFAFTHCNNESSTKILLKFNFVESKDKENPDLNTFTLTQV